MFNDASGDRATAAALSIVEGCDHAGISLVTRRGGIETVAPTDDVASRADELQYGVGEGPNLQSIAEHETVYAEDLLTEGRWPQWSKAVADELGLRSVLALQLFVGTRTMGSLNLYSRTPAAFPADRRTTALSLAALVAVAVAAAHEQDALESALVSRTVIGQAEGMLMQRLGITADQSFAALVRMSQARNLKLHLVAAEIVESGVRPELFA